LLAAGPTNYSFADLGQNAAISIGQATAALLVHESTPERLLTIQVVTELSRDIGHAVVRVQRRVEAQSL